MAARSGDATRADVATAIAAQAEHFDMPGLQLGFAYEVGAVVPDGSAPPVVANPVGTFVPSGRPGARLAHAWLAGAGGASTLDRIAYDRFTLLVGPDGASWRAALAADELDVAGVMAHLGRHHHEVEVWCGMVRGVVATLARLSRAWGGWAPREIDLGGGFPSPRDPTGRALASAAGRPDRVAPIEDFAGVVTSTLRDELATAGIDAAGIALEVEPGRALHADAGVMLTRVVNVKHEPGRTPERWLETDTTEMFLADLLIEHDVFPIRLANDMDRADPGPVDVMGISCGFDVLAWSVPLPPAEPGDLLAFLDTGAYQDATSSNFNAMPRPATVLVCDDAAEIVKRAETPADVFARDTIPERLLPADRSTP